MKKVLIIIVGCLVSFSAIAQQNLYKWRLGVHGGLGTYYGDLSTGRFLDPQQSTLRFWDNPKNLSYGLQLEYSMSNAWSFRMMATRGSFEANDRASKWNGDPYQESEQYERALNFRTSYHDFDAMFIYNFDNGSFFGEKSFFAPYIGIGLGYMKFKVEGDLYQENGSVYHYWTDNTIRDFGEFSPDAINATIIEQDGVYETNLSELQAEGINYTNSTLTFPLAMGLKFRLNDRINLNLETLLHYTMSDYLDDVSGDYPTIFDSAEQFYAANPSGVVRNTRGKDNNLKDIYGTFNLSIGYNFGYKKQSFKAPIFYLGETDPVAPVVNQKTSNTSNNNTTTATTTMTSTTITNTNDKEGKDPVIVKTDNIQVNGGNTTIVDANQVSIIRDTIYQQGKVIYEKVIIRTDTVREIIREEIYINGSSGSVIPVDKSGTGIKKIDEVAVIPLTTELDTVITLDPVTMKEDVVVYAGDVAVEKVPEEAVFTLESIKTIELESIKPDYFHENIGYLKDDLSEEKVVLAEVQESNFELIALRNEINELKTKDNKSKEDIDALYKKLDDMGNKQQKFKQYNDTMSIDGNNDYQTDRMAIQKASDDLSDDLDNVRTEIIYLEAPASSNNDAEYERIKEENNEKIASLEKEMRKLRKNIRKSKRADLPARIPNPSRVKDKEKEAVVVQPTTLVNPVIVDNSNPALELEYQLKIATLEKELSSLRSDNELSVTAKDAELADAKKKLVDLESKINASQTTGNTDAKTLEYIAALEGKLNQLNELVSNTQKDIEALKNRPDPKPNTNTTTIIRPEPKTQQIVAVTSPAREAISRVGKVNIYYGTGKSEIRAEFYNELDRVVNLMNQYIEVTANLTGFTDKSGNADANFRLSKKRTEAVLNYLITRGISSSRIRSNYYGDTQSSSTNDPFSRRVEIILSTY